MRVGYRMPVIAVCGVLAWGCAAPTPSRTGEKLFKRGEFRTAHKKFQESVTKGEDLYRSYVYLARIAGIQGEYKEGIELGRKALEENPDGASAHYYTSILYQLDEQYRTAERLLAKLAERPGMGGGFSIAMVQPRKTLGGSSTVSSARSGSGIAS